MAEPAPEEVTEEPPASVFVDGEQAIARIKALGETARAAWFVLLGYLAFVGTTLLGVRDLDFFSATSSTQLPLVGISIPTMTFFLVAPILGAALHVYLHLYLVKLWDALAEAPPMVGTTPLGDRVFPWLVVDWALRLRPDQAIETRPLDRLGNWVMAGIVWLAGPIVLGLFWWQSATARDPWLTLVIAAAFAISLYASFCGWRQARACLRHAGREPPPPSRWRFLLWRWGLLPLAAVLLVVTSWLRTEGGLDYYADRVVATIGPSIGLTFEESKDDKGNEITAGEARFAWVRERFPPLASVSLLDRRTVVIPSFGPNHLITEEEYISWTPLARIELTGGEIAARPADWLSRDTAERRFRVDWCGDRGLPPDACAPSPHSPYQSSARVTWCEERIIDDCPATFAALDDAFDSEWKEQRQEYLANIVRPNLRDRDLRNAAISGTFLAGVDLRGARLEGADLSEARLEGADLSEARLEGADLGRARLEGADLRDARLEGVDLRKARLEGANLRNARLEGADLGRARLEGANLSGARLEGANLSVARLEGANLYQARLVGADLQKARLVGADLNQAQLEGAYLREAQLVGASLIQARLEGADLRDARLEGADLGRARLVGADLRDARLEGADLRDARLEGADLRDARLEGADLRDARLAGADLREARLVGADLSEARLKSRTSAARNSNRPNGRAPHLVPRWPVQLIFPVART